MAKTSGVTTLHNNSDFLSADWNKLNAVILSWFFYNFFSKLNRDFSDFYRDFNTSLVNIV